MLCSPTSGRSGMLAMARHDDIKLRALGAPRLYVFGAYIMNGGRGPQSVGNNLAFEVAAELRDVFVVGIEHGGSARGQRLNQFVFRARNSGQRIEKFQDARERHW